MDSSGVSACMHRRKLYTMDGETVCACCGVVLLLRSNDDCNQPEVTGITIANGAYLSSSNLYVAMKLGSKECKDRKQSDLSKFSNACTKLRLPHHVSEEAWKLYRKIVESPVRGRITKAEFAAYAVYIITMRYSLAILEDEITNAVMMSFCAKKIRKIGRITLIMRTCADVDLASHETVMAQENKNYHINTSLKRLISNPALFDISRKESLTIYSLFEGSDSCESNALNAAMKARLCVKLAATLLGLEEVLAAA